MQSFQRFTRRHRENAVCRGRVRTRLALERFLWSHRARSLTVRREEGRGDHGFLRYTFSPTFSSRSATETFPSVLAMMIVLPEDDGPNSLPRSTLIVRMFPSTVMSTFFKLPPFRLCIASINKGRRTASPIGRRS